MIKNCSQLVFLIETRFVVCSELFFVGAMLPVVVQLLNEILLLRVYQAVVSVH